MKNAADISDTDLIKACGEGDAEAVDILYRRYWPRVRGLCLQYLRATDDAEDVAQEVLVNILLKKKILGYQGKARLWSWLYRVTINACKSQLRRKKSLRETRAEDWESLEATVGLGQGTPDPETLAIQAERQAWLKLALQSLGPRDRRDVTEIYLEKRPYAEVAKRHSVPLATLGVHVMRAKALMAKWIRAEWSKPTKLRDPRPEADDGFLPEAA